MAVPTNQHWEFRLLGELEARNGDLRIARFSRPVALLLARLALQPRGVGRDDLAEWIWPDVDDPRVLRNRFRNALSTLRDLLEPPGVVPWTVVIADRRRVHLNTDAYVCDAVEFERQVQRQDETAARACYRGDLLPGYDDDWVVEQRRRFASLHAKLSKRASAPAPQLPIAAHRPLVAYPTAFFGRETESARLAQALLSHRLVVVTGFGGCGKTRLCAEVAGRVEGFEPKVFVTLSECTDASQIATALRAALGLRAVAADADGQVASRLAGERALLVFDNLEHLDPCAAETALQRVLDGLPRAHLLVTSRAAVGLSLAYRFPLRPLPLPRALSSAGDALRSPAVAMFVDRARAARTDFRLHDGNVADLVEACTLLDGMPALIELAAARMGTLSAQGLRESLQAERVLAASGGPRAVRGGRHRSHAAIVDWSWRQLAAEERKVLAAAVSMRSGWTEADLQAVAAQVGTGAALKELLRLSFVQVDDGEDIPPRYQIYRSIAEPVRARLSPDEATRLRERHRRHYAALAARLHETHAAPHELDLPNFEQALVSASDDGDDDGLLNLCAGLREHWISNGTSPSVLESLWLWVQRERVGTRPAVDIACVLARLYVLVRRAEPARASAMRALAWAADVALNRGADAMAALADAALAESTVRWLAEDDGDGALPGARRAVELARASGDAALTARALLTLGGLTHSRLHEHADAERLFEESEALFLSAGDLSGALETLPGRVTSLQAQRREEEAIRLALDGEQRAIASRKLLVRLLLLNRLGESYERLRRFEEALAANQRLVRLAHAQGIAYHLGFGLWNQVRPLARLRRPEPAAELAAFSHRYWQAHSKAALEPADERYLGRIRRLVTAQIGPKACSAAWARGWAMSHHAGVRLGGG